MQLSVEDVFSLHPALPFDSVSFHNLGVWCICIWLSHYFSTGKIKVKALTATEPTAHILMIIHGYKWMWLFWHARSPFHLVPNNLRHLWSGYHHISLTTGAGSLVPVIKLFCNYAQLMHCGQCVMVKVREYGRTHVLDAENITTGICQNVLYALLDNLLKRDCFISLQNPLFGLPFRLILNEHKR